MGGECVVEGNGGIAGVCLPGLLTHRPHPVSAVIVGTAVVTLLGPDTPSATGAVQERRAGDTVVSEVSPLTDTALPGDLVGVRGVHDPLHIVHVRSQMQQRMRSSTYLSWFCLASHHDPLSGNLVSGSYRRHFWWWRSSDQTILTGTSLWGRSCVGRPSSLR